MASLCKLIRKMNNTHDHTGLARSIHLNWISPAVSYAYSVQHLSPAVEHGFNPTVKSEKVPPNYKCNGTPCQNECLYNRNQQYLHSPSYTTRQTMETGCRIRSLQSSISLTSSDFIRFYSDSTKKNDTPENNKESADRARVLEDFQHQEIVGPTVERDMSAVASELRQELNQLRKSIYVLSKGLAVLGLAQLTCGAWIHWITKASPFSEVSLQSFFAFAFPFTFAYLLRQGLKPMTFFTKMEEQGRLQIITLSLQATKGIISLFQRVNAVVILSAAGISLGLLVHAWSS